MATPFSKTVGIPDIIWSSLQNVLDVNISHLVKDIAKTVQRDPAPLLQAVRANKMPIYIFDEASPSELDMRCSFVCQKPETPLFCQPCGRPILWSSGLPAGSERCAEHAYRPRQGYSLPVVHLLNTGTEERYFLGEDDTVYTVDYEPVGTYDRDTKALRLFTVM